MSMSLGDNEATPNTDKHTLHSWTYLASHSKAFLRNDIIVTGKIPCDLFTLNVAFWDQLESRNGDPVIKWVDVFMRHLHRASFSPIIHSGKCHK